MTPSVFIMTVIEDVHEKPQKRKQNFSIRTKMFNTSCCPTASPVYKESYVGKSEQKFKKSMLFLKTQ